MCISVVSGSSRTAKGSSPEVSGLSRASLDGILDQLRDLESRRRDGAITLPDGDELGVTNLQKVFWPKLKLTKGDLLRYYVEAAPYILPVVKDRPLTMKRLPNGIGASHFYQHRAPDIYPPHVRVEHVPNYDVPTRFIGENAAEAASCASLLPLRKSAVSIGPGATAFTVMRFAASSRARTRVSPSTAALLAV